MELNTDVLIVGAGPTGLMMACQLTRFGIPFKIIDKQLNREKESRAFTLQAKSMEIFQNLGIASEFLSHAIKGTEVDSYFNGKMKFNINFTNINVKDTPFPAIYYIPQSKTEKILLEYLEKKDIHVQRQTELLSFTENNRVITADIKNTITGNNEKIHCHYIIGCDGAHSIVRELLNIPFVGASYQQEFVLADVSVKWPLAKNHFTIFLSKKGILLFIPLNKENNINRLIIAGMDSSPSSNNALPTIHEIEDFGKCVTHMDLQLTNPVWISKFHLHHRAVKQYQKGNAFIVGDAAHIHTPVGGQGMNTGLQDASNLAWKIAFVLKYKTPTTLLETYQTERQRIGEILVNTTDRIFGFMTQRNFIVATLRQYVLPVILHFLTKSVKFNQRLFHFISELGIRYHKNAFVMEQTQQADTKFLAAPQAGYRAPDAPIYASSLFELFRKKPCNILLFQSQPDSERENKKIALEQINLDIIGIHSFIKSPELELLFDRYGISSSGVYFIRPDGYIGFRAYGEELESLQKYLKQMFATSL